VVSGTKPKPIFGFGLILTLHTPNYNHLNGLVLWFG